MSEELKNSKLEIKRVIFIGRTYEEYFSMFNLNLAELKGEKVLDCPAGACSFTAIGRKKGLNIEPCDIAYTFNATELYNKGKDDLKHAMEKMQSSKSNYCWRYFKNISHLKRHRMQALTDCIYDMEQNPNSYKAASLPKIPYKNNEFDNLLSAHFLFMYADYFDYHFHKQTLNEMLRVTKKEIRIFPIVNLKGERYEKLDDIINYLSELGCKIEEVKVDYEFQTNANTMLKIKI
ncbi:SAM-dependent methyltransferase [Staphylococcus pseudoxylosus]|uniref:SAM-dependent methyltransferase n=1 Tax=Staphylococcus pseudoxylosus TaxID=2282419 RepID=UPI002DBEC70F|nr:SAM-dependent methyltransferase [Staphylococcus pseudoxylosus]MEB6332040.1 SAM-dependent methyltransferase [Staphylococcus pseudoxylosus]